MLNCLIVDDEPLARQVLENYISRTPELQLAASCANAIDAYKELQAAAIDILFLDIKMPLIDGLSFLRSLKKAPSVIFTTAFSEHAVESNELKATDYLLKPFSYNRFHRSIEKVMKTAVPAASTETVNYLFIKTDQQLVKLFHADILFIEARKDYLKLVTKDSSHLTHMTMKYISSLLPAEEFIRCHRSYIVSRTAITVIGKGFVQIGLHKIPVGESFKENLQHKLP